MSTQIDFVISAGMFIVFMATILIFMYNHFTSYTGIQATSEMRTVGFDTHNFLFSGKGLPTNWEDNNFPPLVVGLTTDLFRIPIIITETNNTARDNVSINVSITFDSDCAKRAWNNTVRIYDNNSVLIPITLYNQSFCSNQFLNTSDVVFNATLGTLESKTFFVYFSDDKNVTKPNFTLSYTGTINVTSTSLPLIKVPAVSIAKLRSLRNYNYNDFIQLLGGSYKAYVEISAT